MIVSCLEKLTMKIQDAYRAAILNIEECYKAIGKYDEAMEYTEQGLKINPVDLELLFRKAHLYQLKQDFSLAQETYEQILKIAGARMLLNRRRRQRRSSARHG